MLIPFILEKAISLFADKEAVVCGEHRFTYKEFNKRIAGLSNFLISQGIRHGDCIAILHPNSHEFLEAYFSAGAVGAILNPLNFRLSAKELAVILNDSGAKMLIAASRFHETVEDIINRECRVNKILWTGDYIKIDSLETFAYEDIIINKNDRMPAVPDMPDTEIAHLYYTSGTTGKPKGVMLSHKNVCTHSLAAIAEFHLTDKDRWIHAAPLFHLADAWAAFAITWVGGKHVLIPEFNPPEVLNLIEKEKITITNMIPTMLNMLVNTKESENTDFSSLRVMLSGGSPIAPDIVRSIMDVFGCDYVQTYGMTETCPYLTVSILKENLINLPPEKQFFYKARTGRPYLGVQLKVVRDDGTEVAHDDKEVGEIIVKGDIVTTGYWNRPQETADAIKNGWLYTGDLAVIDSEGYVNIVDRKKDMIITGGENVYSVEVENVLYSHSAVLEAMVIGIPDSRWGESVKGVVVLKEGCTATEEEIIRYCKENIAAYKTPKSIDFMEELPRTGSGKLYKKALKDFYAQRKIERDS